MRLRVITTVAVAAGALLATALPAMATAPALTYVPDPVWWGTNGRVVKILPAGDKVFLAGGFDYVGPATGYGVGVDGASGVKLPGAPLVDGPVYASVPDGSGGWYVAGAFTHVGGVFRRNAAQITSSGAVTKWNPRPDGPVYALAPNGASVVLGGDFANAGGVAAQRLAAVSAVDGNAWPGWSAATDAPVRALLPTAAGLLVGGDFTSVDGTGHRGVARVDASTGSLDPSFTGTAAGSVLALSASPDESTVYAGGTFTTAAGSGGSLTRNRLAAFSGSDGSVQAWNPGADGSVLALATDPGSGTVYAGGLFGTVGGAARVRLGGISPSGTATAFDAALNGCNTPHGTKDAHSNPVCTPEVDALAVSGGSLYVGGRFGNSGTAQRHDAAAFALADGSLTGWNPVASNRPFTLSGSAGNVFVGGELTSVNGLVRKGVAALDATTGAAVPTWNADANDMVYDLALNADGSKLYLAGHFTTVLGVKHNRLALVSTSTGALDKTFKPSANNDVLALGLANGSLYVAGQFKRIGKIAKLHVAKLSPTTGAVDTAFTADTWGPSGTLRANGMVLSMQVAADGSKVYLAGPFDTVNNVAHRGIAVVNGTTGAMLPNQLGGVQKCWTNGDWIVKLQLSPDGQRLYGGDVCPDYIYQWDAVNLSSASNPTGLKWKTLCNAGMQGALEVNGNFYYGTHGGDQGNGGYCWATPNNGPRVSQQRYFVFDSVTGYLQPDKPDFDSPMGVFSFAAVPQGLLVGGDFTYAGAAGQVHQGLALFPGTP